MILSILTVLVEDHKRKISINVETRGYYDFLFSKAKYSKSVDGKSVKFNVKNHIKIIKGKHPLIGRGAVHLDFTIEENYISLVITGPNTGKNYSFKNS